MGAEDEDAEMTMRMKKKTMMIMTVMMTRRRRSRSRRRKRRRRAGSLVFPSPLLGWPCTLFRSTAAKAAVLGKHLALRCPDRLGMELQTEAWKLLKTGTPNMKLLVLGPAFCAPQHKDPS